MNKSVFQTRRGRIPAKTDWVNRAGGRAYKRSDEEALAQYSLTGTFHRTYYCGAREQLADTLKFCEKVDPTFIAKTALYARQEGFMKDMPMFLAAFLAKDNVPLLKAIFPQLIDNAIVLKKFVHILRTGVVGRKSLGTAIKNLVKTWLHNRYDDRLFRDSVGGDVTLADIIKLVHPKPVDETRSALYAYIIGKTYNFEALPELVQHYELFKKGHSETVPNVPFQFLTSMKLGRREWIEIARNAPWHMCRMNLNTFQRHGVFNDLETVTIVANKLRDAESIAKVKVFPYQLLIAYKSIGGDIPRKVVDALHDAMEIATKNVPAFKGKVVVCPDVSWSMQGGSITGNRGSVSSAVRPVDVAALVSAVVLRNNPDAELLPFDTRIHNIRLEPRDTIMTNASKLGNIRGGGTDCSLSLKLLNRQRAKADLVIYVSDNESWADSGYHHQTGMASEWSTFKSRNRNAKLVCIDTVVSRSTQAEKFPDTLNIGGWSDNAFKIISLFADNKLDGANMVDMINKIPLG